MFDKDRFIQDCRDALVEQDAQGAVRELLASAVSTPREILRALGEPTRAEVQVLYRNEDLVILNVLWGPQMAFYPHDHRMWANIGIYAGQEDNTFFRRSEEGLTRQGVKRVMEKDVIALGENAIHAVTNPLDRITAAIHVYGGDFFGKPRSEWDPETFEELPYDIERTMRAFEESNTRLRELSATT